MQQVQTNSSRLPKVLMLHGHTQNGFIFSNRLAAIRKSCKSICEMIFIDAPHVVQVPTPTDQENNHDSSLDLALVPRTWWIKKNVFNFFDHTSSPVFEGFDESLEFISHVIDEKGPFDACFGFSQGAALAGVLSSILEEPSLHASFSKKVTQKPFKSVVLVSGFKVDLPHIWSGAQSKNFDRKLLSRSLHIIGKLDTIVSEDSSKLLSEVYLNPRIEFHNGNHFVPSNKIWRDFFLNYFSNLDLSDESLIPSPNPNLTQS